MAVQTTTAIQRRRGAGQMQQLLRRRASALDHAEGPVEGRADATDLSSAARALVGLPPALRADAVATSRQLQGIRRTPLADEERVAQLLAVIGPFRERLAAWFAAPPLPVAYDDDAPTLIDIEPPDGSAASAASH